MSEARGGAWGRKARPSCQMAEPANATLPGDAAMIPETRTESMKAEIAMDGNAIEITLPGLPRGKGRPRFSTRGGFARAYTDDRTASYEGALRMAGALAMAGREPLVCALALDMVAVFPIPASWSKRKQAGAAAGTIRPTGKPDVDNLLKCVDGLNKIVWQDDAQIVRATVTKRYGTNPELAISVRDWTA